MKKLFGVIFGILLVIGCTPSDIAIQNAIAKTQMANIEKDNWIQTAIAQTQAAAPTSTPLPTKMIPTQSKITPYVWPRWSPTKSPTPMSYRPTNAIKPTIIPTISNPVLDITIKVKNNCSEQHTVIMNGPVRLKYIVDPGKTIEWQGARGTYSWTVDGITSNSSPQYLSVAVWTLTLCP